MSIYKYRQGGRQSKQKVYLIEQNFIKFQKLK